MKQPTPSDFIVEVKESSVSVIFKPSNSDYTFHRLADADDIARYGPLTECRTWGYRRHRRLSIGRGRTDGALVSCQGDHHPVIVRVTCAPDAILRQVLSKAPTSAPGEPESAKARPRCWRARSLGPSVFSH
jgi:hypothetical protein